MNKGKSTKGITLVALIITIIVLLILAVVAIGAVNNTGIINYADNSVGAYKAGRDNEISILQNYVDYINENDPTKKNSNGETELYGSELYGIEFVTETTGKFYTPDGGYLDVTFSNNEIICGGENLGKYTIHTLENNKIMFIGDEVFTTNGTVGMDNSTLDGRTYICEGDTPFEFDEGEVTFKEGKYSYYVWDSYIFRSTDFTGIVYVLAENLNGEGLTTFVYDNKTFTLQQ